MADYHDELPIVNRRFALEPRIFSRWRWAFCSAAILDRAHQKYDGKPYRLARGDVDVIVLPQHLIPELNKRDETILSSHKYHSYSVTAYLNELDSVLKSNFHMKVLLQKGTPALPSLVQGLGRRAQLSIERQFPWEQASWTNVQPLPLIAQAISQLVALLLLGAPICDDEKLIELTPRLTQKAFSIAFGMRLLPCTLESILVWLLPPKWDLGRTWRDLDKIIIPELEHRRSRQDRDIPNNVASWMMLDAKSEGDADPAIITRLMGSIFAAGIWSTSTLILSVIVDLVAHPQFLDEIRAEIRLQHEQTGGQWDFAAFNGLGKLDSAMKESSRRAPATLLVYGRVVEQDIQLSSGIFLRKGQHIATPLHSEWSDPLLVPDPSVYDPLRWYKLGNEGHRRQPFTDLNEINRWGSGRRACPGRFLASICAKIMLVELLNRYDFEFLRNERPSAAKLHEFVYIHPSTNLRMRARREFLDMQYL